VTPSARLFPRTITIERPETEQDEYGDILPTSLTSLGYVDIPCTIQRYPGTGTERPTEQERFVQVTHRIMTPTDISDILDGDQVTDDRGETYRVTAWRDEGDRGVVWNIYCKQTSPS
jgi:hypothetical protein